MSSKIKHYEAKRDHCFRLADGRGWVFTPSDGQVQRNGTFVSSALAGGQSPLPVSELGPACFTLGTLIRTPDGAVAVETLTPGDLVETMDHGPQALRWVGMAGVIQEPSRRVIYVHLPFDRHEIIFAEGAPSESCCPGGTTREADQQLSAEIAAIFPDCPAFDLGSVDTHRALSSGAAGSAFDCGLNRLAGRVQS